MYFTIVDLLQKKAQEAHALLDKLGPKIEVPLYNQPSDTSVYHENKKRHLTFKKRLIEYLKQQASEKQSYDKYLTVTYSKLMSEWLRKVDKVSGKGSALCVLIISWMKKVNADFPHLPELGMFKLPSQILSSSKSVSESDFKNHFGHIICL